MKKNFLSVFALILAISAAFAFKPSSSSSKLVNYQVYRDQSTSDPVTGCFYPGSTNCFTSVPEGSTYYYNDGSWQSIPEFTALKISE